MKRIICSLLLVGFSLGVTGCQLLDGLDHRMTPERSMHLLERSYEIAWGAYINYKKEVERQEARQTAEQERRLQELYDAADALDRLLGGMK